jgi:hypothetical protein
VGLKRLRFESEQFNFLTPQDIRAAEAITVAHRGYQSTGLTYEIDPQRAAPHWSATRCSGPTCRTCAWKCWPASRNCWSSAAPAIWNCACIRRFPTIARGHHHQGDADRLRVVNILEEHRKIAAIVGDALNVPARGSSRCCRPSAPSRRW